MGFLMYVDSFWPDLNRISVLMVCLYCGTNIKTNEVEWKIYLTNWAQLFKSNDVVCLRFVNFELIYLK